MDRREFLAKAGLVATWAGIVVTVSSCSDDKKTTSSDGTPTSNDLVGVITGGGHTHSGARITQAQLMAGAAVQLTLTGSGHTHTVDLSAQQIMDIADGTQVSQLSSNAGHVHTVTFN